MGTFLRHSVDRDCVNGRSGHDPKLFNKRFRPDVRKMFFFIMQLLITGMWSLPVVLTVALLTLSRNTSRQIKSNIIFIGIWQP